MRTRFLTSALLLLAGLQVTATLQAAEYVELTPSFVGTIGSGPRIQYLRADVALRATDADAVSRIEHHDPLIRNALVSLFARQTAEDLTSMQGKEDLRNEALARVQAVLEEEEGQPLVSDLLFTNLLTQ
ncbi:flagellar basal body-associated FliL family protein [Halopseudomonas salegens]|uniref:Flagellar protein FliL n=1 Tax=Halopseudomonas salegens TaxID=1434072 RepID=A0A1H2H9W3_9GAMM|nr:flagellar basal body-associated FliL family protein [Halopseudomonas salegens]SDU28594.1 flagellar FliL protein [Halopseudomonas salegens]